MNYSYIPQQYYIEGTSKNNDTSKYTFQEFVLGSQLDNYINYPDVEDKIIKHLAFYHELTHFEQDQCFFACISKGLFEEIISDIVYSPNKQYDEHNMFPIFDNNEFLQPHIKDSHLLEISTIYRYIFKTSCEYMCNQKMAQYAKMGYQDMLESHAEIKSLFNFILDFASTQKQCNAINQMIYNTDRFGMSLDYCNKTDYIQFHGNANYINRRYQVVRHNFITYFINRNSDFLRLNIDGNILDLKILLFIYSTELPLNNPILMNYLRMVDFYMMIAIELSMAIPPAEEIICKCNHNPENAIYYNPANRFYRILNVLDKNAHFFNSINIDKMRWEDLFNYISLNEGGITYQDLFTLYEKSLMIQCSHRSTLTFGQLDHIIHKRLFPLKQTLMGMYDIFIYHNKSFAIHHGHKFTVAFSQEKNKLREVSVEYSEWELIYNKIHHIFPDKNNLNTQEIFAVNYITDIVINKFIRWRYILLIDGFIKHPICPFIHGCPIRDQSCRTLSHYPNINSDFCIVSRLKYFNPSKEIL